MHDKLFNFFWKIEEGPIIDKENKTFTYGITVTAKYPFIIICVWYVLNKLLELCKNLISHE